MGNSKCLLTSRLTFEEKENLRAKAEKLKMSEAAYVRECIRCGIPGEERAFCDDDCLMTLKEFADRIHVSYSLAKKLCLKGAIPYHLIGGDYRIKRSDYETYVEASRREREQKERDLKPMYTVPEVASLYNVTPQTVDKWIRSGKMPAYRIDERYLRIKQEDLACMMGVYAIKS